MAILYPTAYAAYGVCIIVFRWGPLIANSNCRRFHQLLTHPESLARLRSELDSAAASGALSETTTWKESQALPYLSACFKEAGRIHPPFGLHLERVVPKGGLEVCGTPLPAGTIVGMNAWVVHRDPNVFGPDADAWRPERWLEGDEAHIKKMDAALCM